MGSSSEWGVLLTCPRFKYQPLWHGRGSEKALLTDVLSRDDRSASVTQVWIVIGRGPLAEWVSSAFKTEISTMKMIPWVCFLTFGLMARLVAGGPEPSHPEEDRRAAPDTADGDAAKARLELSFKESLTDAVLVGTWQMKTDEGHPAGKTPLTPPRPDKYGIKQVERIHGDNWIITARIQYEEKDVTLPIAVRVAWAGDTPVITIDDLAIPLLGTYSARVMVYKGFYTGTWSGSCYGGILSGEVVKAGDDGKPGVEAVPKKQGP